MVMINPVCEKAKETQMYRTVFWTLWERARVEWFGRMALKHMYYHMWNKSPVHVQCVIQDALGWCTGMTQRDEMGREVGAGFKMGNTCTPMADSCQCMAKPIHYCKVISLQLKKKKELAIIWRAKNQVVVTIGICSSLLCNAVSPLPSYTCCYHERH